MKKTILALSLIAAANAFAARLDIQPRRALDPVDSERMARVLRDARSEFTLEDGSKWIIHRVPAQNEPSAYGVTRFGADGSARVFLVSDWLPKGSIPRGWCGQVSAVAQLSDGRVLASAGWTDGTNSHNGIFVLRALPDGRYATDQLIELPGVAQIAGGPRNTIAAVTDDASIAGGGPLLTLLDTQGHVLGRWFDGAALSAPAAAQNSVQARLQRISESRFALYDPSVEMIRVFDLAVANGRATLAVRTNVFVGDDAVSAGLHLIGIEAAADGDVLVARSGVIRGKPGTQLTVYDQHGGVRQSTTLDRPWNFMLRENGRIRGVVMRGDVVLDTIGMRAAE